MTQRHPALDGVRGLAIALVMALHFVGQFDGMRAISPLGAVTRAGWAGVDLFFVLSGFLITGILLNQQGAPSYFRAFYWRRALRILPAFAVLMAMVWGRVLFTPLEDPAAAQQFRDWQPWYWTFTTSQLALFVGGVGSFPYGTGFLWSLSIEENFYLAWPWVVRRVSGKALVRVLVALLIAAPLVRLAFLATGDPTRAAYTFTLCRVDALAAGGLLAVWWRAGKRPAALDLLANAPGIVWLMMAAVVYLVLRLLDPHAFPHSVAVRAVGFTFTAGAAAVLVAAALVAAPPSALGRFCRARPLRVLGRYAYGLYLFHPSIAAALTTIGVTSAVIGARVGSLAVGEILTTLILTAFSLAFAAASWRLVEAPALWLKERVPYSARSPKPEHLDGPRREVA